MASEVEKSYQFTLLIIIHKHTFFNCINVLNYSSKRNNRVSMVHFSVSNSMYFLTRKTILACIFNCINLNWTKQ